MFRVLNQIVCGALVLASLVAVVVGVVSYWRGVPSDFIYVPRQPPQRQYRVSMIDGVLHAVTVGRIDPNMDPTMLCKEYTLGRSYARGLYLGKGVAALGVGLPFWALVPVLLLWPSVAYASGPWRRWRRRRRGLCAACGYDLRGLTEARCPECGRPFSAVRDEVHPNSRPTSNGT